MTQRENETETERRLEADKVGGFASSVGAPLLSGGFVAGKETDKDKVAWDLSVGRDRELLRLRRLERVARKVSGGLDRDDGAAGVIANRRVKAVMKKLSPGGLLYPRRTLDWDSGDDSAESPRRQPPPTRETQRTVAPSLYRGRLPTARKPSKWAANHRPDVILLHTSTNTRTAIHSEAPYPPPAERTARRKSTAAQPNTAQLWESFCKPNMTSRDAIMYKANPQEVDIPSLLVPFTHGYVGPSMGAGSKRTRVTAAQRHRYRPPLENDSSDGLEGRASKTYGDIGFGVSVTGDKSERYLSHIGRKMNSTLGVRDGRATERGDVTHRDNVTMTRAALSARGTGDMLGPLPGIQTNVPHAGTHPQPAYATDTCNLSGKLSQDIVALSSAKNGTHRQLWLRFGGNRRKQETSNHT
eukprot:GHVR01012508.1.p1 GENE.GHVR01012508.1~~GHVR01012508.1.p1  ORF type:complete len:470 (-),score=96.01 GHVR01012508.1:261-1499(-)